MNKVNINRFFEYEQKKTDKKQCSIKILCIWLLTIFFYFVGINPIYTGIVVTVINIPVNVLLLKCIYKFDDINYRHIFNGCYTFYLSCLLILLSYKVMFVDYIFILLIYYLVFIAFLSVLLCSVFFIVNSGKYKYKDKENRKTGAYAGALFGILLTRFLFEGADFSKQELQVVLPLVLLFITIIFNFSNFDLLKVVLIPIKRHRGTADISPPSNDN